MDIIQSNDVEDMVPQPPTVEIGGYDENHVDSSSCRICFFKLVGVVKSMKFSCFIQRCCLFFST